MQLLISKFDTTDIEEHIATFQKELHIKLPEEYMRFIQKYNGGETPHTEFNINGVRSDVRAFYGMGEAKMQYNFQRLIDNHNIIKEYIADKMLPIATTVFGDTITIRLKKGLGSNKEVGCIFFRYHDEKKNYIKLADSLSEFAANCQSEKIDHIPTIEERKQAMIKDGLEKKITDDLIRGWQAEIDRLQQIHQEEFAL